MKLFRSDNTEGYTREEMKKFNAEFTERFEAGEWADADEDLAGKWFSDEVARR